MPDPIKPMRSAQEIQDARSCVVRTMIKPGLSSDQRTLLQGMSVALQWAAGEGGSSLQELLDGRPLATRSESQ